MYLGDGDGPPHEGNHVEQEDPGDVEEGVAQRDLQQIIQIFTLNFVIWEI